MKSYTYSIYCLKDNTFYYGVRYGRRKIEFDIGINYFSSSKIVKNKIKVFGKDCFIFKIRKIFNDSNEAIIHENKILQKIITNPNCLNENVSGAISKKYCSIGGKIGGKNGIRESLKIQKENKTGLFSSNNWVQKLGSKAGSSNGGKIGGKKVRDLQLGIFNLTNDEKTIIRKNGGNKTKELCVGIFGMNDKKLSERAIKSQSTKKELNYKRYVHFPSGEIKYFPNNTNVDIGWEIVDKFNKMHQRKKYFNKEINVTKFVIPNTIKELELLSNGYTRII